MEVDCLTVSLSWLSAEYIKHVWLIHDCQYLYHYHIHHQYSLDIELVKGSYYGGVTLKVTCLWTVNIICGLLKWPVYFMRTACSTCSPLWHLLLTHSLCPISSLWIWMCPSFIFSPCTFDKTQRIVIRFNWKMLEFHKTGNLSVAIVIITPLMGNSETWSCAQRFHWEQ